MSNRSPDHGEIDDGGVVTIRRRVFDAVDEVVRAAYDLFYDTAFSGWHNLETLKKAVDKLDTEINGHKEV